MVDITEYLDTIEAGVYGEDIRQAIHDALETLANEPTLRLKAKTITANGTYNPSVDNADGYSSVIVDVPQSGGAEYQQILDDTIEAILEAFKISLSEYSEIPDTIKKQAVTSLETAIRHGIEVDYNAVSYTSLSTLPG
jgi:hypothetical protein